EANEVGMLQIGDRAELVLESQDRAWTDSAQTLQREAYAAFAVAHPVNHAHSAAPELAEQLEAVASRERHLEALLRHSEPAAPIVRRPIGRRSEKVDRSSAYKRYMLTATGTPTTPAREAATPRPRS